MIQPTTILPPAGERLNLSRSSVFLTEALPQTDTAVAGIIAGSTADRYHPAIWLSGEGVSISFSNLQLTSQTLRGVVIGEDSSTHSRSGSATVTYAQFFNVHGGATNSVGAGPGWDITGDSYWIWIEHCGFQGSDGNNDPTGDLAPAVLLDGRTNYGVGLITINDSNSANGAIKYYVGANGGGLTIKTLTSESLRSPATVWIASVENVASQIVIQNIVTADAAAGTYDVETDNFLRQAGDVTVIGNAKVKGPAQLFGTDAAHDSPLAQQQEGVSNRQFLGRTIQLGAALGLRQSASPTSQSYPPAAPG